MYRRFHETRSSSAAVHPEVESFAPLLIARADCACVGEQTSCHTGLHYGQDRPGPA